MPDTLVLCQRFHQQPHSYQSREEKQAFIIEKPREVWGPAVRGPDGRVDRKDKEEWADFLNCKHPKQKLERGVWKAWVCFESHWESMVAPHVGISHPDRTCVVMWGVGGGSRG